MQGVRPGLGTAARAARAAALPLVACVSHPYLCATCCFVPQITSAHGFEEMGGLVGLARLPVPTDKDLLFLIDISYSMDEIAGYEDGMDPIDQRDNRELTRRLDVAGGARVPAPPLRWAQLQRLRLVRLVRFRRLRVLR